MGHAITIGHPLRLDKSAIFGPDVAAYACSGTPADCVKIAKHYILKDRRPTSWYRVSTTAPTRR